MDWIFVGVNVVSALVALGNWRLALYLCLILDVVRDPLRKLAPLQPTIITVIVGIVWLAALLGALHRDKREAGLLFRRYSQLRISFAMLALGLVPGMMVSILSYTNGWILAAIGGVSYSAPFVGVILGYLWPRRTADVYTWMRVYVLCNAVCLTGGLLESMAWNVPCLGGLQEMRWIRNYGTDSIALICGFYRSPDVMGIHAAHVIVFAALLSIRQGQRHSWSWLVIAGWASVSLILCGRRKMIVIPLIALATYISLVAIVYGRKRITLVMVVLAALCVASFQFLAEEIVVENEYTRFAGSIATEGMERAGRSFTEIIIMTVKQSGWLGDGLGTVTQGRQYMGVVTQGRDWQEDGIGRLFKELGIPGVTCICVSALSLLRSVQASFYAVPQWHPASQLQFGFCGVVAANAASFAVSHQAYSGDPSTVLIVGFCMGIIIGLPRCVRMNIEHTGQKQPILRS